MRVKFANGFESDFENHIGAAFCALGATEIIPKPATPAAPQGPPKVNFFYGYNDMGSMTLMARRGDEKTYFVAPRTPPVWYGETCPDEVWAEWNMVRPLTPYEREAANAKYEKDKFEREQAAKKQANAVDVRTVIAL